MTMLCEDTSRINKQEKKTKSTVENGSNKLYISTEFMARNIIFWLKSALCNDLLYMHHNKLLDVCRASISFAELNGREVTCVSLSC